MTYDKVRLEVGDQAPEICLPYTPFGDEYRLSEQTEKRAVVVNFVPAAFSRGCTRQVPEIQRWQRQWEERDAEAIVISCDNSWSLAAWRDSLDVDIPMLSDFHPHGEVARSYGVYLEHKGIADRVVFVVSQGGRIAAIERPNSISELPDYDPVTACLVAAPRIER